MPYAKPKKCDIFMRMKKIIVTTTINEPTEATLKYCEKKDWTFIIVGDTKTPHDSYRKLAKEHSNVIYMDPEEQEKKYKELSDLIGWKSIQRRNIGFVEAYALDADIVATVDDDNIPYESWGKDLLIGKEVEVDMYEPETLVFDPLSITKNNHVWHRGYPIELVQSRHRVEYKGKKKVKVLIQADLWEGDPDIDAIARLTFKPIVTYSEITGPYASSKISPFNSQNTFFAREVLSKYAVLPHIGRMDDIWGGYILQKFFPRSLVYNKASVYQDRNVQDLITNLEKEIIGYRNNLKLIENLDSFETFLPEATKLFYQSYQKHFNG
jgi:hypothetical protein